MKLSLHRCKICGTRWLLWPDEIYGGGWNLLDKYQRPGSCCDNVTMGDQIEHLRDFDLSAFPAFASSHGGSGSNDIEERYPLSNDLDTVLLQVKYDELRTEYMAFRGMDTRISSDSFQTMSLVEFLTEVRVKLNNGDYGEGSIAHETISLLLGKFDALLLGKWLLVSAFASPQVKDEEWRPKVGDRVYYLLNERREPGTVTRVNGRHITVKIDLWPRKRTTSPRYLVPLP